MTTHNPYEDAYNLYWSAGWRNILPITYGEKAPPPEGYTGREGLTPSFADCYEWSIEDKPQNICLRMPDNVIGLDVDHYENKTGYFIIQAIEKEIGPLPATWVSSSRDGTLSGIRFFKVPPGLEFRTNIPGGVDTIQNHHRYAMVWPSVHPNGGAYQWRNPQGQLTTAVPNVDDLAELPHEWVTRLTVEPSTAVKAPLGATGARNVLAEMPLGDPCHHMLEAVGKIATGGDRHDTYGAAVLAICGKGREGCPGAATVLERLQAMFTAEVGTGPHARLSAHEATAEYRRSLTGALAIVANTPQGTMCYDQVEDYVLSLSSAEQSTGVPTDSDELETWIQNNAKQIDWAELWADDTEDEYILYPILPARRQLAIYSAPKVGKSLLLLEIAAAIATGRTVLGATPDHARHVLYVDLENDPRADIRTRLTQMGYTPDVLTRLHVISFPHLASLDSHKGGQQLLAAVGYYTAELVIIDTVSRTIEGDENENDTWLQFYRNTGLKLKQAGVSMVRLDHAGKDETKGQRGGSAKGGDVDYVWRLSRITDDTYRLDCEMNRAPLPEKTLILKRLSNPLRHEKGDGGAASVLAAQIETIINGADQLQLPADTGREALAKSLQHLQIPPHSKAWREAATARKTLKNEKAKTEFWDNLK